MNLSEQLEYEDLTLEERLYEVEAAITDEYREIHKQAIAEWIAQLEDKIKQLEVESETLRKELSFFFTEGYIDALLAEESE